MNENNARLIQHLAAANPPPPATPPIPDIQRSRRSETTIPRPTVVLVEHEVSDVDRQVLDLDVKEVPLHENLNHPTKPLEWTARKSD